MRKITVILITLMIQISSGFLFGNIQGFVTNTNGISIAGATVEVAGIGLTTTDPSGYYLLEYTPIGNIHVYCYKDEYNIALDSVQTIANDTVNLDFTLTQPNISVSPLFFTETLNPGEYLTSYLSILNTGDGDGSWTATINYPSSKGNFTSRDITNIQAQDFSFIDYTQTNVVSIPGGKGEPLNTRSGFDCPDATVFAYPPLASDNGYSCEEDAGMMCFQNFSGLTESFTTVTIYAIHTSAPSGQRELLCEVYGPGSTPGTLESSNIVMADPVATGMQVIGYDTYSYTFDISASNLAEGWIGIQATSGGTPTLYWLNTYYTPSYMAMQNNSVLPNGLAMCLSSNLDNWLTLDDYEGTVPANGGIQYVDVNFNADGMVAGEVYTAEIVIATQPNVGTFNIPVTMTIAGDQLCPVTDLEVELVNMVTGQVDLDWVFDTVSCNNNTFQYFLVKRNGLAIGITTYNYYSDFLPGYGTYCYTVLPFFIWGYGIGATYCVEWEIPEYCHNPDSIYNEQWVDHQEQVSLTIENCGLGMLDFMFPDYVSGSRFACDMEVALYDTYGDGWNGGSLDVFVNGNLVLDDITLTNGGGPEYFSFPVEGGDDISTIYTAGQYSYENYYEIYDGDGVLIHTAADESIPVGIVYGTCPQPSFILDVQPAMGQIQEGQSMNINVTYDATGFPTGLFDEWLKIETNDPQHEEDSIYNQMFVYTPATFYGYVMDCNSGLPMAGVEVSAGGWTTTTNSLGYYEMNVNEDIYDVGFNLVGFEPMVVLDSLALSGVMTEISICMSETPYPVSWVWATPDEIAGNCLVEWGLPMGPYEIIYDDGEADDFVIWTEPGNAVAVKFTPVGYPATIIGGRINVGDGSFPVGANFIGTQMAVGIMDDDGVNNMPGTVLDSFLIDITNYGWVEFYDYMNTTITDGDFYIVSWQLGFSTNSAPIAVDTDPPTVYRSYVKLGNDPWSISPYQDFMMRAYVHGPNAGVVSSSAGKKVKIPKVTEGPFLATSLPNIKDGFIKDGEINYLHGVGSTRNLTFYQLARVSDFDPNLGPQTGVLTPIANPVTQVYEDMAFGAQSEGFYAYAVKAVYESNESDWVYSNTVPHLLYNTVTLAVLSCNDSLENIEVVLLGMDYPYEVHEEITNVNGIVVFDSVIDGYYDFFINGVGYEPYVRQGIAIFEDCTGSVELIQKMYPPTDIEVNPLTSEATWESPMITQLYLEDFEDPQFPPDGWQATTIDAGWYRSDDAGLGAWAIPPGDGYYAVTNDDMVGSTSSGEDYLITPMVDLRESESFNLHFRQFYDGAYSFLATVEYSWDNGNNWYVLETMSPSSEWVDVVVDLSSLSGPSNQPVWLAFHGDDQNIWSSGWAVDNVEVKNGPAPVLAYYVFLDNVFEAQTGWNETTYTFNDLTFGEDYEACVLAVYDCGTSDPVCTTWESVFLTPPLNLTDEYLYGTDEVPLLWNPPVGQMGVPDGLAYFNIYRDSNNIANVPYEGQLAGEWITYIDTAVPSNDYSYWVSAVYELDIFGYPGDFAESAWEGPDDISVVWGSIIPFFEDWGNANFEFNNWTLNENSANWSISSQEGEPLPSAEFTWDPLLENDYTSTLTSYPIIVDYLTEGELFLSFDLKLIDRNTTGNEHMLIEIFDGTTWHLAADFTNSGSREGFSNHILNITPYTNGNAINVRFNATGQNSFDIISWFVDNISVYRECFAPENLVGDAYFTQQPICEVCWDAANIPMPISEWIHWDSGENYSSVGLTDGGTFSVAARWDESQLEEYIGTSISKVRFVPLDGFSEIILKVWTGDYATTLVYSEDVTAEAIANEWNEFTFDQSIPVVATEELWVGYTITHVAGTFPAGTDEGPAIVGYGDMISTDGYSWDPVSSFGFNNNWNIQVFVFEQSSNRMLTKLSEKPIRNDNVNLSVGETREEPILTVHDNSRDISGFNIYRMSDMETEYQLIGFEEFVNGHTEYCYFDFVNDYQLGHYYQVTAVYLSETDECESGPAMAYEIPGDDFVYLYFEGVEDMYHENTVNVFPNPAKDKINISSKEIIINLRLLSFTGQYVYTKDFNNKSNIILNTSSYPQGVYLLRVETKSGITTKKIVINR